MGVCESVLSGQKSIIYVFKLLNKGQLSLSVFALRLPRISACVVEIKSCESEIRTWRG